MNFDFLPKLPSPEKRDYRNMAFAAWPHSVKRLSSTGNRGFPHDDKRTPRALGPIAIRAGSGARLLAARCTPLGICKSKALGERTVRHDGEHSESEQK